MNKKKLIFWIILGIVVVGVVLAILFVTLFGNKDTKALAENLNSYTTSDGYLCSTSERNQKIDAYFDETFSLLSGDDANEVKNYKAIYENYEKISSYFNKEIAYMNYNNTYKSKRGEIERNLKDAQNAVDNLITKIDEALDRIEEGTYGYCEETGEPIGIERLEARPVATLSIEAQERHERMEKTFDDEA